MTEHEALRQAPMCCVKTLHVIVCTLLLHYPSIAMAEWSHARSRRRETRRGMVPPPWCKEELCLHDVVWNSGCMIREYSGNI